MLKHLDNSLLVFSILLCNSVFCGMECIAQQSNVNGSQLPTQQQQQANSTNGGTAVVGQPIDLKSINPTDTVAVVTGNGKSEPNVFKTDKKIFPPTFTGWVYIMSGADYLEYIKDDDEKMKQQNVMTQRQQNLPYYNYQQNSNQMTGHTAQNGMYRPENISPQAVVKQPVDNQQSTYGPPQQNVQRLETVPQQGNIQQPSAVNQQSIGPQPIANQQMASVPQIVSKTTNGSERIDQGKIDNEIPEVLIHDGAVYTLANSVEISKPSTGNVVNSVIGSIVQPESAQIPQAQLTQKQQVVSQPSTQQLGQNFANAQAHVSNVPTVSNSVDTDNTNNMLNNQNNPAQLNENMPSQNNVSNTTVANENQQSNLQQQNFQQQDNQQNNIQSNGDQNNVRQQYL